ncbi:cytochrome P450 [Hygrophoropsis aurantiaca]|uniref:Cytochrome P450 n=1 Tax=Hygrophoropsis aurantiaca TaxID=72124 RepID=A0ACB8A3D0_9AGAM|nr:cytochrome P450 [Hygrophoropsis aurantiaca]
MSLVLQGVLIIGLTSACWFSWKFLTNPLDNIPGPQRQSFWKGNLTQVFDAFGWDFHRMLGEKFGRVTKFHALFGDKMLYTFDPKAMHHILVKDQDVYGPSPTILAANQLMFGEGLLSTIGEHHRQQRKMMNPVFSINHMRHMIPVFQEITNMLQDTIVDKLKNGPQEIEMLEWFTRTALELVGQSGLGYSFDSLKEGSANPYSAAVKMLIPTLAKTTITRQFVHLVVKIGPASFRKWLVKVTPWKTLHELDDIVDIMDRTSTEVFESKKAALEKGDEAVLQQVGQGKDIMSILLRANMAAAEKDRLPDKELLGQMTTLVFAAMDTTSGALARTFLTLAQHPEAQERLREEVTQARAEKGVLDYDDLVNLPYLDAVCRETLRVYPPVTAVIRTARKDAVLPFSNPITGVNGKELHDVMVPKGTTVVISILNANRNREIWGEDALEWKPERWLSPLPKTVTEAGIPGVYSHLMTFIGGGRSCIDRALISIARIFRGFKFSQLEMKIVLASLIEHFTFKAPKEIFWSMGLSTPRVKDSQGSKVQLPLVVDLVKKA